MTPLPLRNILMRIPSLVLAALLLGIAPARLLIAQDSVNSLTLKEFHPLWTFERPGKEIDSCAEYGGLLVLSMNKGDLIALKSTTGDVVWERNVGDVSVSALSFSRDPKRDWLLVSSMESLVALDRKTGEFLWLRVMPHGCADATVMGHMICAASYDGKAYGLNLDDGKIVWESDFLDDAPADPPGFDGKSARFGDHPARPGRGGLEHGTYCFSVFDQCRALAFDVRTGERRAAYATRGWMYMKPTITEKHVFVGSQDKHMYCFDKQTGAVVWKHPTGSRVEAACALDDRHVYWGSCDANLYCLNRATGEVVWKFATDKYPQKYGGPIYESAILEGTTVILPAMEGQVYTLDATSGKLLGKHRPSPQSQIDGAEWDGERLFVQTRKNFDNAGEEAIYALQR